MLMSWPSRTPMTGVGDAMAGIAARKIAIIAKGFIDMMTNYELKKLIQDCPHFRCNIEPTIKEGEKSKELMRCKHINAVRHYLLDEMILPNLAKNL